MKSQITKIVQKYFVTDDKNTEKIIIETLMNLDFAKDYYNFFIKKKNNDIFERKFSNDIDNYIYKYFYNLYRKKAQINIEDLYSLLLKKFHKSIDDSLIIRVKKIRKKAYHDYYYNTHKKRK